MAAELPNEGTIDPVNEVDKPVASGPPAEAFSLPTDAGEDSARLFIATRQKQHAKGRAMVFQLFREHYTRHRSVTSPEVTVRSLYENVTARLLL